MKIIKWFKKQKGWVKGGIIGLIFGSLYYALSFRQLFDYSPNYSIELFNYLGIFYGFGAWYGSIYCEKCLTHFFLTYLFGSVLYFLIGAMMGYLLIDCYYKYVKNAK